MPKSGFLAALIVASAIVPAYGAAAPAPESVTAGAVIDEGYRREFGVCDRTDTSRGTPCTVAAMIPTP
jgi:hypothetical protein